MRKPRSLLASREGFGSVVTQFHRDLMQSAFASTFPLRASRLRVCSHDPLLSDSRARKEGEPDVRRGAQQVQRYDL